MADWDDETRALLESSLGPDPKEINRIEDEQDPPDWDVARDDIETFRTTPFPSEEELSRPSRPEPVSEGETPPLSLADLMGEDGGRLITPEDQAVYDEIKTRPSDLQRRIGDRPLPWSGEKMKTIDWLTTPIGELTTFSEWRQDKPHGMAALKKGVTETWDLLKKAGVGAAEIGIPDVAVGEATAKGVENAADFGENVFDFLIGDTAQKWSPLSYVARRIAGVSPNDYNRKFEVEEYQSFVEQFQETKVLHDRLTTIAKDKGINPEALINVVEGGSLFADLTNIAAAAIPFGGGSAKALSLARRLGTSSNKVARVTGKVAEVAAKTWESPVGMTLQGAGKAVTAVGKGVAKTGQGVGGTLGALGIAGGGAYFGSQWGHIGAGAGLLVGALSGAKWRLLGRSGGGLQYVGDLLKTAGLVVRSPTQAAALEASFLADTAAGRALAATAASAKFPARALLYLGGAAKHGGESAVKGALTGATVGGALGYIGSPTGEGGQESAGAGAVFGAIGGTAKATLDYVPLGKLIFQSPDAPGYNQKIFANDWLRTRPIEEQVAILDRYDDRQLFQLAQASTLMEGYKTDGRGDIGHQHLSGKQFAEEIVNQGGDMLPREWSREERMFHVEQYSAEAVMSGHRDGHPVVMTNLDSPQPLRRTFHGQGHALQMLQLPGEAARAGALNDRFSKKYGEKWRIEELADPDRAEWHRATGDPLAQRRAMLDALWWGDGGVLNDSAPALYDQYWSQRGFRAVPIGKMRRDQPNVVQWDDLTPLQKRNAKNQIGQEILAEKTAMVLEGATKSDGIITGLRKVAGSSTSQWLLDHLMGGYGSRIRRGAESVGSDIFQDISLLPKEAKIIAEMLTAKAKARARNRPAAQQPNLPSAIPGERPNPARPGHTLVDYDFDSARQSLAAGGYLAEEAFASGLVDEMHFNRAGEVRQNTPRFEADARREQALAVEEALRVPNIETDAGAVLPSTTSKAKFLGNYFTVDQLNSVHNHVRPTLVEQTTTLTPEEAAGVPAGVLGARQRTVVPRAEKPFSTRMLANLDALNEHMTGNHHPGFADKPAMEPLDVQYFEPQWPKAELGRAEAAAMTNEHILPLQWDISRKDGVRVRALDMASLEEAARRGLPGGWTNFDLWRRQTLEEIRGTRRDFGAAEAAALQRFYEPHIRNLDLARIGQVLETGDFAPSAPTAFSPRPRFVEPEGTAKKFGGKVLEFAQGTKFVGPEDAKASDFFGDSAGAATGGFSAKPFDVGKIEEAVIFGLKKGEVAIDPPDSAVGKIPSASSEGLPTITIQRGDLSKEQRRGLMTGKRSVEMWPPESVDQLWDRLGVEGYEYLILKDDQGYKSKGIYTIYDPKYAPNDPIPKGSYLVEPFEPRFDTMEHQVRVHAISRDGKVEIVPHAAMDREYYSDVPMDQSSPEVARAEKAAAEHFKTLDVVPEGGVFGLDVVLSPEGDFVVEINPTDSTGRSGFLDNEFVKLAMAAHLQGKPPAFAPALAAREGLRKLTAREFSSASEALKTAYDTAKNAAEFAGLLTKGFGAWIGELADYLWQNFKSATGNLNENIYRFVHRYKLRQGEEE